MLRLILPFYNGEKPIDFIRNIVFKYSNIFISFLDKYWHRNSSIYLDPGHSVVKKRGKALKQ